MEHINETTLIALVILGGIFMLMSVAIFKGGIDGAIRIWSVLGVLCGAIVSFYFSGKLNDAEVRLKDAQINAVSSQAILSIKEFQSNKVKADLDWENILNNLKNNKDQRLIEEMLQKNNKNTILLNQNIEKSISDLQSRYKD